MPATADSPLIPAVIKKIDFNLDWNAFKAFISFYLIVNSFVPLDLIVIISLAKIIYTDYIEADAWMTEPDYEMRGMKRAKCNTLNLHEEIGQLDYLFCDKTGTLTKNELVFRAIALPNGNRAQWANNAYHFRDMKEKLIKQQSDWNYIEDFFRCINLNHECISVESKYKPNGLAYNGPSIDECCLLDMSALTDIIEFKERDATHMRIVDKRRGKEEEWEFIRAFAFTSERKAMSVIVRNVATKKVFAFVKGADSSILKMITHVRGQMPIDD